MAPRSGSRAPRLTIVVPTRNRATLLEKCLESLTHQDVPATDLELIVVDDGSTDTTRSTVLHAASRTAFALRYVRNQGRGVNAARNTGVREASADIVAFVDDDEDVPGSWARTLLETADRDQELDGIGGPVLEAGNTRLRTCSTCSLGDARVSLGEAGRPERLLGGNMAIRKSTFARVGLFDASLSGRGDEVEWFDRARAHQLKLYYGDDLVIWHRRDHLTLLGLWRSSFRQGRNLPDYLERTDQPIAMQPSAVARYLAHAIRCRCANGIRLAAIELGKVSRIVERWALRGRAGGGR